MNFLQTIVQYWSALETRFIPAKAWKSDLLTLWRERIIFFFFFFGAVVGPFPLVPSLILSFKEGLWSVFVLDLVVYIIIVLVVLFFQKLSLIYKTWITFIIFYSLGTGLLFMLGFYGAGYIWLFGASLIVGAMIGLKAAGISLLINFFSLVAVGIYIGSGAPDWAFATENAIEKWSVMVINFMFINVMVTILVAAMLDSLKRALTREQKSATELKEKREELMQAQKMEAIGTLAGGIAHDFNNILTSILGFSELTLPDLPAGSKAKKNIDQVIASGKRAADLVQQILTFSRKEPKHLKALNPDIVVKEVLKMLRSSLPTTIKIEQEIDSDCGKIEADPTQLHQIVMNLCTNAFQSMEDQKGTLKVTLQRMESTTFTGPFIMLTVSDTGCGMDQVTKERIFDPYFTTKETGKGTGLGLAVIHGIVESYNGFIKVESEIGRGTTFKVFLPVLEKSMVTDVQEQKEDSFLPTGTEHILIVDDEEAILNLHKIFLQQLGYEISSTINSREALEKIRLYSDRFDLLVTDQSMPNLSGVELAREVLKIKPALPIILCTGYSAVVSEKEALAIGIKKYAKKPVELQNLAGIIRQVLDET